MLDLARLIIGIGSSTLAYSLLELAEMREDLRIPVALGIGFLSSLVALILFQKEYFFLVVVSLAIFISAVVDLFFVRRNH